MAAMILIILFSDNVFCIIATNTILFGVLMLNYTFKDCPISLIEDKYLDESLIDQIAKYNINILGVHYRKQDRALVTLELIWLLLMIGLQRVLYLLFFGKFTLKGIL
tara:strand:+ start:428 stop:748 length:321 start_codon:yes stop_codon:yes gene_type:complete